MKVSCVAQIQRNRPEMKVSCVLPSPHACLHRRQVVSVLPSLPKVPQEGMGKFGWFSLQGQVMADLLSYARASQDAVRVSRWVVFGKGLLVVMSHK